MQIAHSLDFLDMAMMDIMVDIQMETMTPMNMQTSTNTMSRTLKMISHSTCEDSSQYQSGLCQYCFLGGSSRKLCMREMGCTDITAEVPIVSLKYE